MFASTNKAYKKSYDTLVKKNIPFPAEKKYFKPKRSSSSSQQQQKPSADSKPPSSTANRPSDKHHQTSTTQGASDKTLASHPLVAKAGILSLCCSA